MRTEVVFTRYINSNRVNLDHISRKTLSVSGYLWSTGARREIVSV